MTILFPTEQQRTLVVVEVMPKCLLMSEMYHVSRWVKMVMFLQYILVTLVILIHITLSHLNRELPWVLSPTAVFLSELSETALRLQDELSKISW